VLTLLLADRKYHQAAAADDDDDVAGCATNKNDQDEKEDIASYNHVSDYAPFYEVDAHWEQPVEQQQQDTSSSPKRLLAAWIRKNHERLGRRVFNTHLRWDMLPKRREVTLNDDSNSNQDEQSAEKVSDDSSNEQQRPQCGKFIYITRNQMDVVASFYHHLSNQKEGTYTESFKTFVYDWMDGKIPFGSSLYHLLSFAVGFADN
jgi:hypothetical protein